MMDDARMNEDLPIIDAHHHLWQLSGGPLCYPWLQDAQPHEFFLGDYASLKRDYLPPDYRRDSAGHNVVKTVHVEAECRRDQQVAETQWLTDMNVRYGMPNALWSQYLRPVDPKLVMPFAVVDT